MLRARRFGTGDSRPESLRADQDAHRLGPGSDGDETAWVHTPGRARGRTIEGDRRSFVTGYRFATAAIVVLLVASCGTATETPTSRIAAHGSPPATITASASPSPLAVAATPSARRATPAPPTPRPTPHPTPTPTPLAVPGPPSGATFTITPSGTKNKMTVTWKAPRGAGTEIQVFGVTECMAMPPDVDPGVWQEGPCLVEDAPLPASVRKLIAKAPASSGKVTWTWPRWDDIESPLALIYDGTIYEALVIAAYSSAGQSKFIIVDRGYWCSSCSY